MIRSRFARTVIAVATLAVAGSAVAFGQSAEQITLGPSSPIAVDKNYRYAITLTCPAAAPCEGILSIETAYAIKPYRTYAKKKWIVGAFPYKAGAGQTVKVPARILGGGAAQLALTGTVKIRADIVDDGQKVGSQILTLTKKRRA